jgi:hypothetical protein
MTVTVPVLGIVILIFVLHTIITHLLNWGYRKAWGQTAGESLIFLLYVLTIVEVLVCIGLLKYYIN